MTSIKNDITLNELSDDRFGFLSREDEVHFFSHLLFGQVIVARSDQIASLGPHVLRLGYLNNAVIDTNSHEASKGMSHWGIRNVSS